MCVITIVQKDRPSDDMVRKMFQHNDHGGGIAWREKDKGVVRWRKNLGLEEMQKAAKDLPTPFILHFRIASSGAKTPQLCHPFPISKDVDLALEGQTRGFVLFHNGHWAQWREFCQKTALHSGAKIPAGAWSDTRALAWVANQYGLGILEMIDEKAVAFGPTDIEVVKGNGWDDVDGIWCSNCGYHYVFTWKNIMGKIGRNCFRVILYLCSIPRG